MSGSFVVDRGKIGARPTAGPQAAVEEGQVGLKLVAGIVEGNRMGSRPVS